MTEMKLLLLRAVIQFHLDLHHLKVSHESIMTSVLRERFTNQNEDGVEEAHHTILVCYREV